MKIGILHTAFLGDLALAGALIEVLSQAGHEIFLFTNRAGVRLYKSDSRVAQKIEIEKRRGFGKLASIVKISKTIKQCGVDALVVPHRSFSSSLIAILSGVSQTVGFDTAALSGVFSHKIAWRRDRHEALRCLDLAKPMVEPDLWKKVESLGRPVLSGNTGLVTFLNKVPKFFDENLPFFVVSPGSVWHTKKYPPRQLAHLVYRLLTLNPKLRCVVSGGPNDKEDIGHFLKVVKTLESVEVNVSARVIDASECLPVDELIELCKRASFAVANDSLPLHVASGVNVPVVGIFGPTSWSTGFGPSSQRSAVAHYRKTDGSHLECQPCSSHGSDSCPQSHHLCMIGLPPQEVVNTVLKLVPEVFENK